MMRIKRIVIKNFLGLSEFSLDPGKINYLTGHKGSGKTSIVEALEKAFTNKNRRTEVIRHGEDESIIFVQTDNDMEIERRIRDGKSDYLKIRKPGESVPQTESFLRKLVSGEIFRPLEFVLKGSDAQAKDILNMLDIPWSMENVQNWFGEIPNVSYDAHILQVLRQIETVYYSLRESVNREIKVLEAQAKGIQNELPQNYDGDFWREEKVQDYYAKVAQAEETNKGILAAKILVEGIEERISTIKAEAEADKQSKKNTFNQKRSESRDFIQFLNQKVAKSEEAIAGAGERLLSSEKATMQEADLAIERSNAEYERKLQELKQLHQDEIETLSRNAFLACAAVKKGLDDEVAAANEDIAKCKNILAAKEQELLSIDSLEEQSLAAVDDGVKQKIETEKVRAGNAQEIAKRELIDIEPLTAEANKVAHMQSFLREFDRMKDIMETKLAPRQEQAQILTARIEKARELPMELLKIAAVPIPEIAIDSDGKIRIDGTLLDGRSEGEQMDLAIRMAKAQSGELKLVCFDGIDKINPADRKLLEKDMYTDDFQYFFLGTTDGDLSVDIEEGK